MLWRFETNYFIAWVLHYCLHKGQSGKTIQIKMIYRNYEVNNYSKKTCDFVFSKFILHFCFIFVRLCVLVLQTKIWFISLCFETFHNLRFDTWLPKAKEIIISWRFCKSSESCTIILIVFYFNNHKGATNKIGCQIWLKLLRFGECWIVF